MPEKAIKSSNVHIAKVVGENDEGITLFVPKDESGVFHLSEGDAFYTMMFVKSEGDSGKLRVWTPWEKD